MPDCRHLIQIGFERRPANALNVEHFPHAPERCRLKTPEHWGAVDPRAARWLLSGGSPLVLGYCSGNCPAKNPADGTRFSFSAYAGRTVMSAIERGLVVHSAHPDFGGTLTVGPHRVAAGGSDPFVICAWGGDDGGTALRAADLDGWTFESAAAAARAFVYQVGARLALPAALRALDKAA